MSLPEVRYAATCSARTRAASSIKSCWSRYWCRSWTGSPHGWRRMRAGAGGRLTPVGLYGEDAAEYTLLPVPEEDYTDEESARLDVLADALDALCVDDGEEAAKISDEIAQICAYATARGWSADARELAGVVVSFGRGGANIRRGWCNSDSAGCRRMKTITMIHRILQVSVRQTAWKTPA